jgi:hypothetical protein
MFTLPGNLYNLRMKRTNYWKRNGHRLDEFDNRSILCNDSKFGQTIEQYQRRHRLQWLTRIKWEISLGLTPEEINWPNIFTAHCKVTDETKFRFRIPTNTLLFKYKIKGSPSCSFYDIYKETLEHLIYNYIHTTWIWYIVLTQPIVGGPSAVGFARVSPKPRCAKGWTFGQHTHYNLLSSKTHQSFSTVFYFGRYLGIISEFYEFIAVAVIAHFMPPAILLQQVYHLSIKCRLSIMSGLHMYVSGENNSFIFQIIWTMPVEFLIC